MMVIMPILILPVFLSLAVVTIGPFVYISLYFFKESATWVTPVTGMAIYAVVFIFHRVMCPDFYKETEKVVRLDNKGVLIGEPLVMCNDIITFRRKRILNKYIIFPEIDGKRVESLSAFTNTLEAEEVTVALSQLADELRAYKAA
jgi:hypothetical protein